MKPNPECPLCCGDHDAAIHDATVSVHAYLRERVLAAIERPPAGKSRRPGRGGVKDLEFAREVE